MVKLKQKMKKPVKKEKNFAAMSVDSFFETAVDDEIPEEENGKLQKNFVRIKKSKQIKVKQESDDDEDADASLLVDESKTHKEQLENLKETDPEFYTFLQQNDKKLLTFDMSDEELDEDANDDENKHVPDDDLEVPSDEEDFEGDDKDESEDEDDDPSKPKSVTLKLLQKWQTNLQSDKVNLDTIKLTIQAFNSALITVSNEGESSDNNLRVEGSSVFNGVIQLCVLHLQTAINRYLGLSANTKQAPHKKKKWKKVQASIRNYFLDLTRLLENITSGNISTVILKHLHQMTPFIPAFATITKPILRRLVTLWSSSEETVRIVSFLCILRITRLQPAKHLSLVLKAMYIAYVRNSKFVSPTTLPAINFMRRSLVEMFALDLNVSYQHSFLYIRQLAIHLRNAVTLQKKDAYQSVYNWQYINSCRLWADLLSLTYNKQQLKPLVYPLVSILTGAIKLIPTAQYFPLRFHCVKILVRLSKETGVFIPILPYILEVLNSTVFNKKHSEVFMKPLSFTCILRVNKKELASNVFRDEVVENIYGLVLENLASESYHIAFPDLSLLAVRTIRKYIKSCHNANHSRKLKQLCDKIDENVKFIETERNKINFALTDTQMIESWESNIRNKGTPLLVFYENWEKTNAVKQKREATQSDDINDYKLPTIIKRPAKGRSSDDDDDGPVDLFPSDSDDEETELERPVKRVKKEKKKIKLVSNDDADTTQDNDEEDYAKHVDIVEDLDISEWD